MATQLTQEHVCIYPYSDHVRLTVFAFLSDFHTNKIQSDSLVIGCILRLQFVLLGSDSLQMSF